MTPADIIAIAVIALVIGAATAYIIRAKRSGRKCIGCPYAKTCGGGCTCHTDSNSHKSAEKANKDSQK